MTAHERVASWAKAEQLAAVEVLSKRTSMNPTWPVPVSEPCVASEEVAARLDASRQAGRELLEAGKVFAGALMATGTVGCRGPGLGQGEDRDRRCPARADCRA